MSVDLDMDSLPISEVEVSQVIVAVTVIGVTTLLLACCCLTCSRRNGEYTVQVWVESDSTAQQQSKISSHYYAQGTFIKYNLLPPICNILDRRNEDERNKTIKWIKL